ncbi:hypothetical protein HBB16_05240 [Pseudonocardia sp. MCCB 268]|nr:hypothetical protein [Pseudonocardia cytotoxica]
MSARLSGRAGAASPGASSRDRRPESCACSTPSSTSPPTARRHRPPGNRPRRSDQLRSGLKRPPATPRPSAGSPWLCGCGGRVHLLPQRTRTVLAEFRTFPTVDIALQTLSRIHRRRPDDDREDTSEHSTRPRRRCSPCNPPARPGLADPVSRWLRRRVPGPRSSGREKRDAGGDRRPRARHRAAARHNRATDQASGIPIDHRGWRRPPRSGSSSYQLIASALATSLRAAGHDARFGPIHPGPSSSPPLGPPPNRTSAD